MAYTCDLLAHQHLYVENQGNQTVVVLSNSSPNQQQSQKIGFTTGVWEEPPKLFQTSFSYILKLKAAGENYYVQIQANQVHTLLTVPSLDSARNIPLERVADRQQSDNDFEPFKPMEPMQPMKMGNMEMQMNPMTMRMGNMEMQMGTSVSSSSSSTSRATRRFCSQCGQPVTASDRFCSACGHQLN